MSFTGLCAQKFYFKQHKDYPAIQVILRMKNYKNCAKYSLLNPFLKMPLFNYQHTVLILNVPMNH